MTNQLTMDAVAEETGTKVSRQSAGEALAKLPQVGGQILADLGQPQSTPYADYLPSFAVETEEDGVWWITDHGNRIALLHTIHNSLDLFEFIPGEQRLPLPVMPTSYHAPTLLGARITTAQLLNGDFGRSSDEMNVQTHCAADAVTITVTERWANPTINSRKCFTVCVDPRFGYIVYTTNQVRGDSPVGIEFANFLAAGLSDSRPGKDRYPYMMWRHPSLGPLKWRSNLVSLRSPGQSPRHGARDIASDGWLGFFGENDWNPVFALTSASQPLVSGTCDNLLDEHLQFLGDPPADAKGHYTWRCEGTLFSCPGAFSDRLVERTPFNDLGMAALPQNHHLKLAPFNIDEITDFESTVPLEAYYRGGYWPSHEDGEDIAVLSTRQARSGRRSMQLKFEAGDKERTLNPWGSSLWLNDGKRYRLSAWFHHSGEGSARVRVSAKQIYFRWSDRIAENEASLDLSDATDWFKAEVEFTAVANGPAILVGLHWAGSGDLFVDDVLLEQLAD